MAKRVRAKVKKELLLWARSGAGYSPADVARRLGVAEQSVLDWESGAGAPTITQLQNLADLYKRPLAVFYLAEPPLAFQPMRDFRRLPGSGLRHFSPELLLEIRLARQQRELALELFRDAEEEFPSFDLSATLREDPEAVGVRLREAVQISPQDREEWSRDKTGYTAFNRWRARIEAMDVLVFQAARVSSDEVSGFAIAELPLPAIVVSRADTPPTRRTFSLLHEFAHLMLRMSGVSDLDVDARRPPEDQMIEVFCNRVAAAALMPRKPFLAEPLIRAHRQGEHVWDDQSISDLGTAYGVSRESVVRRLLTFGLTTQVFYEERRSQYRQEYLRKREREKELLRQSTKKEFAKNPPVEALTNLGTPLVRMILGSYYRDKMTLSDVSSYLGIRTRHIPKIEVLSGTRG